MRYLSLAEVIELHRRVIDQSGGAPGLRDTGRLESAVAQPRISFGGRDLYPSLIEKAGAICFSLVQNHPFVDGNKRLGHAAMEVFLILNGHEIGADVDEQETVIIGVASGQVSRESLVEWLTEHVFETD
ncbi:MAG: type II toxin-antitoxin system death-on-curing family toxin [Gemmatimonadota bacterium]|nr:type II toxin-antitoxin system death-on-curing family toxin [Gemmatimonadota bacterium]